MRQIGEICQALYTEAFTSFCHAYDRAMCSNLPRHHCLLPPHDVEGCTVFPFFSCAHGCFRDCLLDVSRLLGLTLRPSAPVFRCNRDISTHVFVIRLDALKRDYCLVLTRHPVAPGGLTRCCTLHNLHTVTLRMIPTYFQVCVTLCCDMGCKPILLMTEWVCRGMDKTIIPVEDSTKTVPCSSDSSKLLKAENRDCALKYEQLWDNSSAPRSSWQAGGQPDAPTWKLSGTQGTSAFCENSEAPLPHQKNARNSTHPKQLSPFPERLKLPYPDEEISSGYEEDVSFIRDRFTTWVKGDPNDILERHVVDVRKALAEYREASVRRQEAPAQEYFFDSSVPNRSSFQRG